MNTEHPGAAGKSLLIENRFFALTRWVGLAGATLAVVAAIVVALAALHKMTRTANDSIAPTTPRYATFREATEADKQQTAPAASDDALRQKEQAAARAQEELAFERKLQPFLDRMQTSLGAYARAVDQAPPSRDGIRGFVKSYIADINRHAPGTGLDWRYVEGLAQACDDLAADGARLASLPVSDPSRVDYADVVNWYSREFMNGIKQERGRVSSERQEVESDRVLAWTFLAAAASTFGVFVLLTMLLALRRIARNPRALRPPPH